MSITLCDCPYKELKNFRFCGSDVIESEICFVPAVKEEDIKDAMVTVSVDPDDFKIELVCCNLIVVCGFITKKVTYRKDRMGDGLSLDSAESGFHSIEIAEKDISVQIKVPVNIYKEEDLDIDEWIVAGVEVCSSGCTNLVCPGKSITGPRQVVPDGQGHDGNDKKTYHKLIEKDIVSVLVKHADRKPH